MGLGDRLRKLVRPGDPGELFEIPDSGQISSSHVRTSTEVNLPASSESASVSIPGSQPPPAPPAPGAASGAQDSAFELEVRRQMEAQGVDGASAEAQAEQIEGMLKNLTGGEIPGGADIQVRTETTTGGPFSMFSDLTDLTKAASNAPFPAFPQQPAAEDPLDKLAKLAQLRDSGVLTEEEFAQQKAKLLGET